MRGIWIAIIGGLATGIPATLAAIAALRQTRQTSRRVEEVHNEIRITSEAEEPTLGDFVAGIYERMGALEGLMRAHLVDAELHPRRRRRKG